MICRRNVNVFCSESHISVWKSFLSPESRETFQIESGQEVEKFIISPALKHASHIN